MSKSSWVRRRLQKRSREIGGKCRPPGAAQVVLVVKNLPANAGGVRDTGSIPGSGRLSGGGHGNSLQYPCLENPLDRGARRATVHGVTGTDTTEANTHTHHTVPPECHSQVQGLGQRVETLNTGRVKWGRGLCFPAFPHCPRCKVSRAAHEPVGNCAA